MSESNSSLRPRACVFCASANGNSETFGREAESLGRNLAAAGWGIVYGGAKVGLMGRVANAALAAGAEVIGVIPEMLVSKEIAHDRLTELHIVKSMHERKALMAERSSAFLALPGGFGTLEEFVEVLTWAQLRIHTKPCVLINLDGYYDKLVEFLDHAVHQGFLKPEYRSLMLLAGSVEEAVALIKTRASGTTAGVDLKVVETLT